MVDLVQMYLRFAEKRGLKAELLKSSIGSFTVQITGSGVCTALSGESGKHCVQRESKGRMHTSMVALAVLPLYKSSYKELPKAEIETTTQMGSGPGGQNRNSTESSVRMHHKPTGITVLINRGRDQHQNRRLALEILTARVNEHREGVARSAYDSKRRNQLGGGTRSDKIRTYNFPRGEVTDHRTGRCVDLKKVLKGHIDSL